MILHDRVLVRRLSVDHGPYPAELQPLTSVEVDEASNTVVTRYKVFLGPRVDVEATDSVVWRGREFHVDGDVEQHGAGGRLRHQEAVLHRVSG